MFGNCGKNMKHCDGEYFVGFGFFDPMSITDRCKKCPVRQNNFSIKSRSRSKNNKKRG